MMRAVFRVDSSSEIGSGHIVRCLTLAQGLRSYGVDCTFICRDYEGNLGRRVLDLGFEVRYLQQQVFSDNLNQANPGRSDYNKWLGAELEVELNECRVAIGEETIDWLIVDHYAIDYRWEFAMRQFCKRLMVIDDLANRQHQCDLLLDQNLVEGYRTRYDELVSKGCSVLAGPEFALLQPQYADLHHRIPPRSRPIQRILVYFGGADSMNLTGKAVDAFIKIGRCDISLDVVMNASSPWNTIVRSKVSGLSNVKFYESLPSLAHLIANADLCVGASGATTWERCCLGLPTVVVTMADNQIPLAEELSRLGGIDWIGRQDSITVDDLHDAIKRSLENPDANAHRSSICKRLVDGNGVSRVVSCMLIHAESVLTVRSAYLSDESLLLSWANDPSVRINSFNSNQIDPETHRDWFWKRLRNIDGCQFYVVCTGEGFPIGQVRFEKNKDEWETHYSLSSCARGKGLGRKAMELAIKEFRKTYPDVRILGRVKSENVPSCKVFESLGFHREHSPDGNMIYRLDT